MMKKNIIALSILAAIGLVGCGSGGGQNHAAPNTQTNKAVENKSVENKVIENEPVENKYSYVISVPKTAGNTREKDFSDLADLNQLYIEDEQQIFTIYRNDELNKTDLKIDNSTNKDRIYPNNYSLYGLISQENLRNHYLFLRGTQPYDTTNLTGIVTYEGNAIQLKLDENTNLNGFTNGKVNLVANFDNKTLNGAVTGDFKPVEIVATIKGEAFQGGKENFTVKGIFFGPEAEEVIGRYTRNKTADPKDTTIGVFGATKK